MRMNKIVLLVVCVGMVSTICGHNPNQIGYELNDKDHSLTVHFTLRSAMDLIKKICPEVKDHKSNLKISDYFQDLSVYFNTEIQLQINGADVSFFLKESQLNRHDAFLKFDITQIPDWDTIEMTVNSFTEVYKRTKNIVNIGSRETKKEFYLDKNNRYFNTNF